MIGADGMGISARTYPDIVRDVLTALTNGVAGERCAVVGDPGSGSTALLARPARRVSSVSGLLQGSDGALVPYTFGLDEYELLGEPGDPESLRTIRFRPRAAHQPATDTDVTVNYYPRSVPPSPITDVTVGSVARTLLEALSHELAVVSAQVEQAYDSAFVDTASGSSLDRLVALLGYERFRAGRPTGTVRFGRRANASGTIVIPAGTPVTDAEDKVRYEATETRTMQAGESTCEVQVRAATEATPTAPEHTLVVVQRSIAGVDTVDNERATVASSVDETDAELRARAKAALSVSNKGTAAAMRDGLLALPDVRDATIVELPNGVPGELRVTVSTADGGSALSAAVRAKLEELRPAGVRLLIGAATTIPLAVRLELTLAGSHLPPAEIEVLHRKAAGDLTTLVARVGVGQKVRAAPAAAAVLADDRVVDVSMRFGPKGSDPGAPGADFTPEAGASVTLDPADVSFDPDRFEQGPAIPDTTVVLVTATLAATVGTGTPAGDLPGLLTARLSTWIATLTAGTVVDAAAVLDALRDDDRYQLDPLKLLLRFGLGDQFVEVAQGGAAFTVQAGQSFSLEPIVMRS